MALWSWWQGDALPDLAPLPTFRAGVERDADVLHPLAGLAAQEIAARLGAGHRAYVARLDGTPVAYGWVATLAAAIGELDVAFALPPGDRYLWDFATLPAWRGRGLYPRLLQAILAQEGNDGRRFWIINAPENRASAAGIAKAGFRPVSELAFLADWRVGTEGQASDARARIGAALLGVPLLQAVADGRVVAPCWRCVVSARQQGGEAACWPYQGGVPGDCACG